MCNSKQRHLNVKAAQILWSSHFIWKIAQRWSKDQRSRELQRSPVKTKVIHEHVHIRNNRFVTSLFSAVVEENFQQQQRQRCYIFSMLASFNPYIKMLCTHFSHSLPLNVLLLMYNSYSGSVNLARLGLWSDLWELWKSLGLFTLGQMKDAQLLCAYINSLLLIFKYCLMFGMSV